VIRAARDAAGHFTKAVRHAARAVAALASISIDILPSAEDWSAASVLNEDDDPPPLTELPREYEPSESTSSSRLRLVAILSSKFMLE